MSSASAARAKKRHGIQLATSAPVMTGALVALLVDYQCIMSAVATVAKSVAGFAAEAIIAALGHLTIDTVSNFDVAIL